MVRSGVQAKAQASCSAYVSPGAHTATAGMSGPQWHASESEDALASQPVCISNYSEIPALLNKY